MLTMFFFNMSSWICPSSMLKMSEVMSSSSTAPWRSFWWLECGWHILFFGSPPHLGQPVNKHRMCTLTFRSYLPIKREEEEERLRNKKIHIITAESNLCFLNLDRRLTENISLWSAFHSTSLLNKALSRVIPKRICNQFPITVLFSMTLPQSAQSSNTANLLTGLSQTYSWPTAWKLVVLCHKPLLA